MSPTYVGVRVGSEAYALPVENVREVAELGALTPVPRAPSEALGVRNLRGQVLPVFDLAALFGLERGGEAARLVVVEAGGRLAGLAIDEVTDVGTLPDPEAETESPLLTGAALVDGTLVGVVDVGGLLDSLEGAETA